MRIVIQSDGTPGNDFFYPTTNDDFVYRGLAGHDMIVTRDGNDKLFGGGGLDFLDGGKGDDLLRGGSGVDTLQGADGSDRLFGDAGYDILYGGFGTDEVTGGKGRDVFSFIAMFGIGSDVEIVKDFTLKGKNADFLGLAVHNLDGERMRTFKELKPFMSQEGDDVHLTFETDETMIIENVRLHQLKADHFMFEPSLVDAMII